MTSKLVPHTPSTGTEEKFPEFPPRDDMQNILHLHEKGHLGTIRRHFGASNSIIVLGELPLRWTPNQTEGHRIPDMMIAFNVDRQRAVRQNGYSINEQGKPPEFVLEIASENTGKRDYIDKRRDYANFGVPEYWRFDSSGGKYHDAAMAGDTLVGNIYHEIEIVHTDAAHHWGHSEVLNLDLCWEDGVLRWWNPVDRRYLRTDDETDNDRIIAEAQAESERQERLQAQAERDTAEARAQTAEARAQELEEELRRQRDR